MKYPTLQRLTEDQIDEVEQWLRQHAPIQFARWEDHNGAALFRGVRKHLATTRLKGAAHIIVPSGFRKSTLSDNSSNFLLAQANPDLPLRYHSTICSQSHTVAQSYGSVFAIFPPDNTDVAVLDTDDIINTFAFTSSKVNPVIWTFDHHVQQIIEEIEADDSERAMDIANAMEAAHAYFKQKMQTVEKIDDINKALDGINDATIGFIDRVKEKILPMMTAAERSLIVRGGSSPAGQWAREALSGPSIGWAEFAKENGIGKLGGEVKVYKAKDVPYDHHLHGECWFEGPFAALSTLGLGFDES